VRDHCGKSDNKNLGMIPNARCIKDKNETSFPGNFSSGVFSRKVENLSLLRGMIPGH
jgi:hypothetical protein